MDLKTKTDIFEWLNADGYNIDLTDKFWGSIETSNITFNDLADLMYRFSESQKPEASENTLPIADVIISVCKAPSKVLPCSHFYSNRCLHPSHCNFKQTEL